MAVLDRSLAPSYLEPMEQEKNLHAKISAAVLIETERIVRAEQITVDQFVEDAMERSLKARRRQALYAYGEAQARQLGVDQEDVERIVHEFRQEEQQGREHGR